MLTIVSAGVDTFPGMSAHKLAREVAGQHGISLESHAARPIHQKLIQQADLVLVMEMAQKERIVKLYPQDRHKVFVLGRFCRKGSLDIADPHRGGRQDFQLCFDRIKESCDHLLEKLGRHERSGKAVAANVDGKE
ncbi:MAG: phosphotyrosine protein phosphatase [Nitrospira sp.]